MSEEVSLQNYAKSPETVQSQVVLNHHFTCDALAFLVDGVVRRAGHVDRAAQLLRVLIGCGFDELYG